MIEFKHNMRLKFKDLSIGDTFIVIESGADNILLKIPHLESDVNSVVIFSNNDPELTGFLEKIDPEQEVMKVQIEINKISMGG